MMRLALYTCISLKIYQTTAHSNIIITPIIVKASDDVSVVHKTIILVKWYGRGGRYYISFMTGIPYGRYINIQFGFAKLI